MLAQRSSNKTGGRDPLFLPIACHGASARGTIHTSAWQIWPQNSKVRLDEVVEMFRIVPLLVVVAIAGCGPSARELRERTLSTLNTEADRWEGGKDFDSSATDAYGHAVSASVRKGPLNYTLEVRSSGPDGLPKNNDDVVVTRTKRHGESSISEQAAKAAEAIASGATSGTIKGVKKGLGLGDEAKK